MNNTGKKFGGRSKGTPNKSTQLSQPIKENLQNLLNGIIVTFDVDKLTYENKIKLLQIGLQYATPKLREESNSGFQWTERPIFKEIDLDVREDEYQPQIDMSE